MFTQPYCGGARPSKQMEADAQKAKPYANKMVILVSATGKVDSVKTKNDGTFSAKLKPGTYKLYEAWRFYKLSPAADNLSNYSTECLKNEWTKNICLLTVTKQNFSIKEINPITAWCDWNRPCLKEEKKQMPE